MKLIPLPQKIIYENGWFSMNHRTSIVLDLSQDDIDFETAKFLQRQIDEIIVIKLAIKKDWQSEQNHKRNCISYELEEEYAGKEKYKIVIRPDNISIYAGSNRGYLYGTATLIQLCKMYKGEIPCMEILDEPTYTNRGYMLDISRGRVPKLENLKNFVDKLALYKINQLQLYVEDSFLLDGFEEIWSRTDPFISEEILELDKYCNMRGVELVPCIATFGHLYNLLNSQSFGKYREVDPKPGEVFTWNNRMLYHTINVSDPESANFIISILDQYISLFRSGKVNICCDETFDLGKGKSYGEAEKKSKGNLYISYVNKLVDYLQRAEKNVMMWGDMLLQYPDTIKDLYADVTILNWNYDCGMFEKNVKIFSDYEINQYVCPSVWGHSRLVNAYGLSFVNIKEMAELGYKYGADGFLNTDWGDSGNINMPSLSVPCMIYGAAKSWNVEDDRDFEEIDRVISFIEYTDQTQKIVGLLRELSQQDIVTFNDFVFFRDYKVLNQIYDGHGSFLHEKSRATILQVSENQLKEAVFNCSKIASRLKSESGISSSRIKQELKEFYLSTRGVGLIQELALIVKKYEYNQDVTPLSSPEALAGRFEYWLMDYCEAWRAVSRESELHSIKKFFAQICLLLRKYNSEI